MLSDVTISLGSQSVTFPGLYLLIGCLIALGLTGFVVAMVSARRLERKANDAADILVVQLERIGDALDRIATQSAANAAAELASARKRERFLPNWAKPAGSALQRGVPENGELKGIAQLPEQRTISASHQASGGDQEKKGTQVPDEQLIESNLSEPARSILFSMLGR
jgi:hypothetical protein